MDATRGMKETRKNSRQSNYLYDYYDIEIPEDCESDPESRGDLAILNAEEQAKVFAVPCEWTVISDDGYLVTVRRKRRNPKL